MPGPEKPSHRHRIRIPAISQTCKQFRAESLAFFYAANSFTIVLHPTLHHQVSSWAQSIRNQEDAQLSADADQSLSRLHQLDQTSAINIEFSWRDDTSQKIGWDSITLSKDQDTKTYHTKAPKVLRLEHIPETCWCRLHGKALEESMLEALDYCEKVCLPILSGCIARRDLVDFFTWNECEKCGRQEIPMWRSDFPTPAEAFATSNSATRRTRVSKKDARAQSTSVEQLVRFQRHEHRRMEELKFA